MLGDCYGVVKAARRLIEQDFTQTALQCEWILRHAEFDEATANNTVKLKEVNWTKSHQDLEAGDLDAEERQHRFGNNEADETAKLAASEARSLIPEDSFQEFIYAVWLW